ERAKVKPNRHNRHQHDEDADLFVKAICKPFACFAACRDFPEEVVELYMVKWIVEDNEDDEGYTPIMDIGSAFGLDDSYENRMFPPSALQGPFLAILRTHSAKG